jgi:hypothetical protein
VSGPLDASNSHFGMLHNLGQTNAIPGSEQSGFAPAWHAIGSSKQAFFVLHLPEHNNANAPFFQSHHPSATNESHPKFVAPKICWSSGDGSVSIPAKVPCPRSRLNAAVDEAGGDQMMQAQKRTTCVSR